MDKQRFHLTLSTGDKPVMHGWWPDLATAERKYTRRIGGRGGGDGPATGQFVVSRFMSMPVAYPANYGSVPQSVGGDGDPLDGLVLTREPLKPGAVINVRAIGVLNMVDDGDVDEKIISVPVDDVDPTYSEVKDIKDLPSMEQQRIEAFFRVYKELGSTKKVELNGYDDAAKATRLVQDSVESYQAKCSG
nr:inorganic diphosphatase [Streptomyces sp. NBC_00830]